jgi:hypothetical protein
MEALTVRPVIQYEGTTARGEPSHPRVDLLAVGEILDRAARALEMSAMRLKALSYDAGGDHAVAEAHCLVALRQIRLLRCRRKRRMKWTRERD